MRYRGRIFTETDLHLIKAIIESEGQRGRCHISRRVCEELRWLRIDGRLKDMACRVALLKMEKDGLIALPAKLSRNSYNREQLVPRTLFGEPGAEISCRVDQLGEIQLVIAKGKTPASHLWRELIDRYHYLGFRRAVGAQLRYIIQTKGGVTLGCIGFSAAAWKSAARDQWIGWSVAEREKNLERVVDNSRFLILPWVRVKGLASKTLAIAARTLLIDWKKTYGYRPILLESFVEVDRFRGTCYRAANWTCVGNTLGRSKYDRHHLCGKPIKSIWLYPLSKNFKKVLCSMTMGGSH